MQIKYLSLFTGIGGFELGINQAYVAMSNRTKNGGSKKNKATNAKKGSGLVATSGEDTRASDGRDSELLDRSANEGTPVSIGYSEIDPYAIKVFNQHFPNHQNYGDITKINPADLPDFDLLCGGFPCQAFSIAGKRRGFEDTRGTLFFDIARILKAKKPRLFLLENVKGLLSHDNGKTFATIVATLSELGYDLQWQVLNSKNFGVPQNRERVFIVGHLRGTARPEVFPIIKNNSEDIILPIITTRITADSNGTYVGKKQTQNLMIRDGRDNRSCLRSGRTPELGIKGKSIRRLTPKECERLQGFPDGWTEGVSDTQRYKMCGNAVTTNVVQAIMEKLISP